MARRSATCEQQLLHAHGDRAAVIDPRRRDLSRRSSSARSSGRGAGPRGSRGLAAGCRSCTCRRCRWSVRFGRFPGGLVPGSWRPVRPPVRRGLRRPASEIRVRGCAARRGRRTGRPSRSSPPGTRRCPGVAKVHAGRGRRATRVRPRWGMSPTLGGRPSGTLHRRCDTDEVDGRGPVFLRDGSGPVRAHPSLIPHFLIPSLITGRERDRRCRAGGPPVLMRSCSPRVASGVWRQSPRAGHWSAVRGRPSGWVITTRSSCRSGQRRGARRGTRGRGPSRG